MPSIFTFIRLISQKKRYPYYLGLALMFISWFLVAPHFLFLETSSLGWETIVLKSQDLTTSLSHIDPSDNNAKKVFRLTVPFLMKATQFPPWAIILLQCLLGYLLYIICYKLSYRILKDSVSATLITAAIAFIHFGRVAFFDINFTWFDAYAYFFLLMALYSRSVVVIFLFCTLAAWTDERGLIALSIVFLFHQFKDISHEKVKLRDIFNIRKESLIVLISIVFYLLIRGFLSYEFGMSTPSGDLGRLDKTLKYMPIGIWTFFEGLWIIILLAVVHLCRSKNYLLLIMIALPIVTLTIVASCVSDITRSGAYLLPILFILIIYLKNVLTKTALRKFLLISFVICFLFPAMIVCADWNLHMWFPQSSLYYIGNKMIELNWFAS